MSGVSIRIAVVAIVVVVAFIMNSTAFAMSPRERCTNAFKTCSKRCSPDDFSMFCDCISRYDSCLQRHPPKSSNLAPPTGTPPKGKGVVDTAPTGGDKQVGGGTTPKGKSVLDKVNVGAVKQLGESWDSTSTSGGTTTIQRSRSGKKR
jgi:hypothetical protein